MAKKKKQDKHQPLDIKSLLPLLESTKSFSDFLIVSKRKDLADCLNIIINKTYDSISIYEKRRNNTKNETSPENIHALDVCALIIKLQVEVINLSLKLVHNDIFFDEKSELLKGENHGEDKVKASKQC